MHGRQAFNVEFKAYEMMSYHGSAKHICYMLYEPLHDFRITNVPLFVSVIQLLIHDDDL